MVQNIVDNAEGDSLTISYLLNSADDRLSILAAKSLLGYVGIPFFTLLLPSVVRLSY
jgi:hypothetical protein